ncbi:MAG TPA: hypothetical protein VGD65_07430 [Chryseosolibacter sp.]
MPNVNPTKTKSSGKYDDFEIASELGAKTLFVTAKTTLLKGGWNLDLVHVANLAGETVDFEDDGTSTVKLELGKIEDLDGCRLGIVTTASRLRAGGDNPPPKALYQLTFFADDDIIDGPFDTESDAEHRTKFYTKLTFKVQS